MRLVYQKAVSRFISLRKNMLSVYTVLTADVKQMDMMDEWEMQKADESFYTTVETSKTFFGIYESLRKYLALYLRLRENFFRNSKQPDPPGKQLYP